MSPPRPDRRGFLGLALCLAPATLAAADNPKLLLKNTSGLVIEQLFISPPGRPVDEQADRLAMPPLADGASFETAITRANTCRWHVSVRFSRGWQRDWHFRDLCQNPVLTVPSCAEGCTRPPE